MEARPEATSQPDPVHSARNHERCIQEACEDAQSCKATDLPAKDPEEAAFIRTYRIPKEKERPRFHTVGMDRTVQDPY